MNKHVDYLLWRKAAHMKIALKHTKARKGWTITLKLFIKGKATSACVQCVVSPSPANRHWQIICRPSMDSSILWNIKKNWIHVKTSETVRFQKYFRPLALARVVMLIYLPNDMCFRIMKRWPFWKKWAKYFRNHTVSEVTGLYFGSISTCFDVHMFAEAPCSKSRNISGWAPKSICKEPQIVVLLCFWCIFWIYMLSIQILAADNQILP